MGRPSKQTPEPPAAGLSLPGGVRLVAWCQSPAAVHRFGRRPVALTLMIESATLAAKRLVLVGLVAQAAIATDRPCSCSHHGPRPADSSLVGCANQLLKRATRRGEARASKQFFGSKTQRLLHRCYTAVTPLLHRCYTAVTDAAGASGQTFLTVWLAQEAEGASLTVGNTVQTTKELHTGRWSPTTPGLQAPDAPIPRHTPRPGLLHRRPIISEPSRDSLSRNRIPV